MVQPLPCYLEPSSLSLHHPENRWFQPVHISVVIPSYNRAHTLDRALLSVINQHYPALEIIVVDDGSNDRSEELIARYPQVRLIQQPNKGVSVARNTGIQAASHEWIAFLDSDDEWLPEKLELIRQAQQNYPSYRFFHSNEIWIRNGIRVNQMNKHQKYGGDIFAYCLPLCVISPSAAVIHNSVFESVGLFNEDLPACEDYDLWLRICHLYPVFYLEQPLIRKYGGHQDQLSRRYWGMDRFRIRALHQLIQQSRLTPLQRQQAQDMLIKKLGILIKGAIKHGNQKILDEFQPMLETYASETC